MKRAVRTLSQKSPIPEEVKRFKPCKSVRIRNDNGTYRVYKYKAIKLPSGKWSNNRGVLIGKIIPGEGFLPNKRYQREFAAQEQTQVQNVQTQFSDEITDVAYGQYALLSKLSQDVLEKLKTCFIPERAAQIYSYALILCANDFVHIDQINDFFQESFLSVLYEKYSFKMGYIALTNLLHDLGRNGNAIKTFEQSLIDASSKNVAIDGHVIRSCSMDNDLAEVGYKAEQLNAPQINLLIAYDIKNMMPLLYRTYRGTSVDKKSILELFQSRSFTDTKFVVDCGFYSANVLGLMSKDGNCYIISVPESNKNVKRIKKTLQYNSGEFIYKSGKKNSARIIYHEEQIDSCTRIIVYKDVDENNSKRKSYKHYMAMGEKGYTQENYDKYCEWWGVYFLQTTAKDSAPNIYSDYKDRWSIETFNNYIKNYAGFNDLKLQSYYAVHGFDFMMLVAGLIHSRLNEAVKSLNKPNISTFDILVKAGHMRMVKRDNEWYLHNTRTKDLDILKSMGFVPDQTYPT